MGYWKSKVLPKIKKVFDKNGPKKAAAAEACKSFEDSKEEYTKEFEEKKTELQPKVVEIYEASSAEIKALVKEPKDAGLKTHSAGVQKFLDELVKIAEGKEKEVVVEEEKKEEVVVVVAEAKPAVAEPAPVTTEPPKVEEPVVAEPPKP
ncbi:Plasma membrane-associated cation-binding protein 1 [Camellia lanceoleosa]|uniref:Plasma membrane-associated cation-binding protein 1 n=1 Tax=Camellia lanceoleosa TaxID=1840588 RepID=A0ACC0GKR6_9ERIC|nr:Plasma membrane-associated cation-binding protein 1 [Camellia lanceoleosa]